MVEGEIKEYTVQEDVEQAIQFECKVRFLLAHSAPIINSILGEKLRYLSDEALAKAIITGSYKIPTDLDPATANSNDPKGDRQVGNKDFQWR